MNKTENDLPLDYKQRFYVEVARENPDVGLACICGVSVDWMTWENFIAAHTTDDPINFIANGTECYLFEFWVSRKSEWPAWVNSGPPPTGGRT